MNDFYFLLAVFVAGVVAMAVELSVSFQWANDTDHPLVTLLLCFIVFMLVDVLAFVFVLAFFFGVLP